MAGVDGVGEKYKEDERMKGEGKKGEGDKRKLKE